MDKEAHKRVKLLPGREPVSGITAPSSPADFQPRKDYCFDLKLGESNSETYPEFSWKELVKEAQQADLAKKSKEGKPTLNPYATDDEDDLKAMAARFDQKYSNNRGSAGKERRRKLRAEDFIDRGAGYDDNDSFIDNSEIYDEIVPEDIQPVHGGFYINSGRLDFKEADVSDCDVDEEIKEQLQAKGGTTQSKSDKMGISLLQKKKRVKKNDTATTLPLIEPHEMPAKVNRRKNSASPKPKGDGSGSSSPARPPAKSVKITMSSQSDSSDSDSSGTSSSSSSETEENEREHSKIQEVDEKPVSIPQQMPVIGVSPLASSPNPAQRRLKIKNVPLNPKLHGEPPLQTQKTVTKVTNHPTPQRGKGDTSNKLKLENSNTIIGGLSLTPTSIQAKLSLSQPATTSASLSPLSLTRDSNFTQKLLSKPKPRRRVTDRNSTPTNPATKKIPPTPIVSSMLSPGSPSPVRKKQKLDSVKLQKPVLPQGTGVKKPRKPRGSSLLRNAAAAGNPARMSTITSEQIQAYQLQLQAQLNSFGMSHLLPPMSLTGPMSSKLLDQGRSHTNSMDIEATAAAFMKKISGGQNQVGMGVTVTEVKNQKTPAISPSSSMSKVNKRSSTPPSRLSTPSPINIPRIPIPSSITVTPSSIKNQRLTPTSSFSTPPPVPFSSPNMPVSGTNKPFTPFDVNALLSNHFKSNSGSK